MRQTITIPLPPRECQQNGPHAHWAVKNRARTQYRQEAFYAAREQHALRMCGLVRISVTAYMAPKAERYRPTDTQNLIGALKGAVDGLVDAGVLADDNHRCLQWGDVVIRRDRGEHEGRSEIVIALEETGR